jgi:hypothetical protein
LEVREMSVRKVMLVLALGAMLSASAFAQQPAPAQGGGAPPAQGAGQGSSSSDGDTLDVTPFFTAVDTSKDDKITAEEWKAAGLPETVFTMFETDKKGYITKESLASKKHPTTVDSNKDKKLSLDELKAHIKSQQAQSSGGAQGGAAPGGAAPGGAAPSGAPKK